MDLTVIDYLMLNLNEEEGGEGRFVLRWESVCVLVRVFRRSRCRLSTFTLLDLLQTLQKGSSGAGGSVFFLRLNADMQKRLQKSLRLLSTKTLTTFPVVSISLQGSREKENTV